MPFSSTKQMRFMFARHPDVAKRWVKEAKRKGKSWMAKKTAKK